MHSSAARADVALVAGLTATVVLVHQHVAHRLLSRDAALRRVLAHFRDERVDAEVRTVFDADADADADGSDDECDALAPGLRTSARAACHVDDEDGGARSASRTRTMLLRDDAGVAHAVACSSRRACALRAA